MPFLPSPRNVLLMLTALLLLSAFPVTIAIGGGGGGGGSGGGASTTCESYASAPSRIQCRLENAPAEESLPEACRVVVNSQACADLYKAVAPCYEHTGVEKDQCFKETAGFTETTLRDEYAANGAASIRRYVNFLLYDLEERYEDRFEAGLLSATSAAEKISQIIDVKKALLQRSSVPTIRTMVTELKTKSGEIWE